MRTRKRKSSTVSKGEQNSSKRARLLSSLWQLEDDSVIGTERSSASNATVVYQINGIIKERPGEYLIAWADDPVTGERYNPNWQPKHNANAAAVKAWESKQLAVTRSTCRVPNRRRRKHKRRISNTSSSAAATTGYRSEQSAQIITNETPNHIHIARHLSQSSTQRSVVTQSPLIDTSNFPHIRVQLSQHSSLERGLYIAYHSSLSTQGASSSVPDHPDSGIGESSPETDSPASPVFSKTGIVPDSQSLPGSSSYVPTSTTISGGHHTSSQSPSQGTQLASSNKGLGATEIQQSSRELLQVNDSLESSPIEIDTSSESVKSLRRSTSNPSLRLTGASLCSPFANKIPGLPRAITDPTPLIRSYHQSHRQLRAYNEPRVDSSSAGGSSGKISFCVKHSEETSSPAQDQAESQGPSSDRTEGQIPDSTERSLRSLVTALVFQTQVPSVSHLPEYTSIYTTGAARPHISPLQDPSTNSEHFVVAEDSAPRNYPSQASTTDESILSSRDPNSQFQQSNRSIRTERVKLSPHRSRSLTRASILSDIGVTILPNTPDSRQPPRPPSSLDTRMSEMAPKIGSQSPEPHSPRVAEMMRRIRDKGRDGRSTPRTARQQQADERISQPPSPSRPSESRSERPLRVPVESLLNQVEPNMTIPTETRKGQMPSANYRQQLSRSAATGSPSLSREELRLRVQSPAIAPLSLGSGTPPVIPSKAPYETEEEPSRLDIEPLVLSKEPPLPVRQSQSVPHTPIASSNLAHAEASTQTMTLTPINLGENEFVIPLSMQPRIVSQYLDTVSYYGGSVRKCLTESKIEQDVVTRLNTMLGRLGNVATHIGLEGGGPSSQDQFIDNETEAIYAEQSSEKFRFLSNLLSELSAATQVLVVAKPGQLLGLVEIWLKGIGYECALRIEPTVSYVKSDRPRVTLIPSRGTPRTKSNTVFLDMDVVIALDETFNADEEHVMTLRSNVRQRLVPVIRLVVYNSVEHLDLCLPHSSDPIDRIRKLVCCVWHTQKSVGQMLPDELDSCGFAQLVASLILKKIDNQSWQLPSVRPIEDLPATESDSSLSDALIEDELEKLTTQSPSAYFPNPPPTKASEHKSAVLKSGKRPFDLDYGDSLELQAKKQKIARTGEEPESDTELSAQIVQAKKREESLQAQIESLNYWAERRQRDFEELRDKWSDLHHDKKDLIAALTEKTEEWERMRTERSRLKTESAQEINSLRQQLLNHQNPDVVTVALKDQKIRQLENESAALKKKAETFASETSYIRSSYQQASSANSDLTNQLDSLKAELEPLRQRAAEFIAWRQEIRTDAEKLALRKEVENLKVTVKSRGRLVMRKEEEIKDLKRGRGGVQTRGSSVQPRSPKPGSRGASPAPGTLGPQVKGPSALSGRFNFDG